MQADLSRRRSSSTEEAEAKASPKAPSVGSDYAVKQATKFGDMGTKSSMSGFSSQMADSINAKQKIKFDSKIK